MRLRIWMLAVIGLAAQMSAGAQSITNLTLNPTSIAGGNTSTGTVTLSGAAPMGGAVVGLSSSNTAAATVPTTVTVPSGQTQATFSATGVADYTTRTTTITATYNGTRTANLTVVPPIIDTLTLSPSTQHGGDPVTGTVTLTGTAPANGYVVYMQVSNTLLASVPASFTIPAGATSGTVTITTSTVNGTATLTVFAYNDAQHTNGTQPQNLTLTETYNDLRVTDYYLPATAHLAWNGTAAGSWQLYRNGTLIATLGAYTNSYDDTFGGGPAPTGDIDYQLRMSQYPTVIQSELHTMLESVTATENQAVDSRIDPRWSTIHYQDFQFADRIYRGGLFVGNANDGSRVGRSFVKINTGGMPTDYLYHTSNLNLYSTGNYTGGTGTATVDVGIQIIPDDTWVASTLKWTTAPTFDPTQATEHTQITFDSSSPTHTWYHWPQQFELIPVLTGDEVASYALGSMNEQGSGWAYFAKNQYDANLGPRITQVISKPKWLVLTATPNPVAYGGTVTVTAALDGLGPGQSYTISTVNTMPIQSFQFDSLHRVFNFIAPSSGTSFTISMAVNQWPTIIGSVTVSLGSGGGGGGGTGGGGTGGGTGGGGG